MANTKKDMVTEQVAANQDVKTSNDSNVAVPKTTEGKANADVNLEIAGEVNDTALQVGQSGKTVDSPAVAVEEYEAGKRQHEARLNGDELAQNKAALAAARAEKYGPDAAETVYDRVEKYGRS